MHTKAELVAAKPTYDTFKCEKCDRGHPTAEALRKHKGRCKLVQEKAEQEQREEEELAESEHSEAYKERPSKAREYLQKAN